MHILVLNRVSDDPQHFFPRRYTKRKLSQPGPCAVALRIEACPTTDLLDFGFGLNTQVNIHTRPGKHSDLATGTVTRKPDEKIQSDTSKS